MLDVASWLLLAATVTQALVGVAIATFSFSLLRVERRRQLPRLVWAGSMGHTTHTRVVGRPPDDVYSLTFMNSGWHATAFQVLLAYRLPDGTRGMQDATSMARVPQGDFLYHMAPQVPSGDDLYIRPGELIEVSAHFPRPEGIRREHLALVIRPVLGEEVTIPLHPAIIATAGH